MTLYHSYTLQLATYSAAPTPTSTPAACLVTMSLWCKVTLGFKQHSDT